jgi:hypothetical protein
MTNRGEGCPCSNAECGFHGDCGACTDAHRQGGTRTACEKLGVPSLRQREEAAKLAEFRLLDFAPCAG